MSALPPEADMRDLASIRPLCANRVLMHRSKSTLFDHLVSAQQDRRRRLDADCPGRLQIYHQLELCRLLDGQIGGLGPPCYPVDELGDAPEQRRDARPVGKQAARLHPFAEDEHRWDPMPRREVGDALAIAEKERRCCHDHHTAMIGWCLPRAPVRSRKAARAARFRKAATRAWRRHFAPLATGQQTTGPRTWSQPRCPETHL